MWQQQTSALRPLGAGERIDVAIKVVRKNFLTFVKAALPVAIVAAVVFVLILLSVASSIQTFGNSINSNTGPQTIATGSLGTIFAGLAVFELFSFLVILLITAIAIRIVGNAYLGQSAGWRDALSFGVRRLPSILWIEFLLFLANLVLEVAFVVISVLLRTLHVGVLSGLFVLVAFLGLVWFAVATVLAVPTCMLENIRGSKAIRRSIQLVRRNWWSTFGTLLLAGLLALIGSVICFIVLQVLISLLHRGGIVTSIAGGLTALLVYLLFFSFAAAVLVVITIDLRVRKEGFDIQLLASQMGVTPTSSALSFMPPARGGGYAGYPGQGGGYPGQGGYPVQGGYPGPSGGYAAPGAPGGGYGPPGSSYPAPPGGPHAGSWPVQGPGPQGPSQQPRPWPTQGPGPQGWSQQPQPGWPPSAPGAQGAPTGWPAQPAGTPPAQQPTPGWQQPGPGTSIGESLRPLPPFYPRDQGPADPPTILSNQPAPQPPAPQPPANQAPAPQPPANQPPAPQPPAPQPPAPEATPDSTADS